MIGGSCLCGSAWAGQRMCNNASPVLPDNVEAVWHNHWIRPEIRYYLGGLYNNGIFGVNEGGS